ncbi:hypothetical protein F0L68_35605 [Solihabitans fulvus]|uniref:TrbC/VIRB2 family protein n=1 Tax=Solihabitans fulvus TaxID=1892852 RepID=A0A5B2WN45_9PSEU|nr:hypothetical protein [Solihabitans fulvus]KAA2252378.1 hypothetical protein F0L68_35605 [Solihabitans fulvus]
MTSSVAWVVWLVDQIPNPPPVAPPGSEQMESIVGNIKWIAGLSLVLCFFAGLAVWSAGRAVDHHRAGRIGAIMMIVGVAGGLAFAIGYPLISHFAGS